MEYSEMRQRLIDRFNRNRKLAQQQQQFASGGPGGYDPFEERTMGSGAFGLAPSYDEYPIDQPIYRSDVEGPLDFGGPRDDVYVDPEQSLAGPIDMEALDAQMAAVETGRSVDAASFDEEAAVRRDEMRSDMSNFGVYPGHDVAVEMGDLAVSMGQEKPKPNLAHLWEDAHKEDAAGQRDDRRSELSNFGLYPDAPGYNEVGSMEALAMGGMEDMIARGTALAQKNWMDHHKPENYDNAEEFRSQMFADGVVNPLYGNQTAEKLRSIYGGNVEPDKNDVVGRAMHAASTKKREINKQAFEAVLARFGGSMTEYDKWYNGEGKSKGMQPSNWEEAVQATAYLEGGGGGVSDAEYFSGMDAEGMYAADSPFLTMPGSMGQMQAGRTPNSAAENAAVQGMKMPAMADVQMGYENEYRAYGEDLPDTEGYFDTPAMSRQPPTVGMPSMADVQMGYENDYRSYGENPLETEESPGLAAMSREPTVGMPRLDQIVMGDDAAREAAQNEQDITDIGGSVRFANAETSGVPYQQQWDILRDQGSVNDYPTLRTMGIEKFPTGVQMPAMADVQAGYENEYRAYGEDLPETEGFYTPAMSREPTVEMPAMADVQMGYPSNFYGDPAVDAAPSGLFSEETNQMSQMQSQILANQSSDADTNDSMGQKKRKRRRPGRSRGRQNLRRAQKEASLASYDQGIRDAGMEFREPVQPSMRFGSAYDVQLGIPTIRNPNYDPALGFDPLPPYQITKQEKAERDALLQKLLGPTRVGGPF